MRSVRQGDANESLASSLGQCMAMMHSRTRLVAGCWWAHGWFVVTYWSKSVLVELRIFFENCCCLSFFSPKTAQWRFLKIPSWQDALQQAGCSWMCTFGGELRESSAGCQKNLAGISCFDLNPKNWSNFAMLYKLNCLWKSKSYRKVVPKSFVFSAASQDLQVFFATSNWSALATEFAFAGYGVFPCISHCFAREV